jgi:hypothetical protein
MRPYTVPCLAGGPEAALTAVTFGLTLVGLAALWLVVWPGRTARADPTTAPAPPIRQP